MPVTPLAAACRLNILTNIPLIPAAMAPQIIGLMPYLIFTPNIADSVIPRQADKEALYPIDLMLFLLVFNVIARQTAPADKLATLIRGVIGFNEVAASRDISKKFIIW